MSPAHTTVAPLADHLPGGLLVLAFVVLVIVAAGAPLGVIAHAVRPDRNWFPGTCDTCGKPNTDGHPCTPAHHVPYWALTEELQR